MSIRKGVGPQTADTSAGGFPGFIYHGGPIIRNPRVYFLFIGNWASPENQDRAARLATFLDDLMHSDYMNLLAQYGVGASGTVVDSVFVANTDRNLTLAGIQGICQTAIDRHVLPEPTDPSTIYVVVLDDATAVDDGVTRVCAPSNDNAYGFHYGFVTTGGHAFYYALVPGLSDACLTASGEGSLLLTQTQEERQTQVLSHEFAEVITNPGVQANEAWANDEGLTGFAGYENGDICNGYSGALTVGDRTWNVQLMYSKVADMASSGPRTYLTYCLAGSAVPLPSLLGATTLLTEDFESYAPRAFNNDTNLGAWTCYQIGVASGVDPNLRQAASGVQGALQQSLGAGAAAGRCMAWGYRFSVAELTAMGRNSAFCHGLSIQPQAASAYSDETIGRFGFYNDNPYPLAPTRDVVFYANRLDANGGSVAPHTTRVSNVYVDSAWQKFDFRWSLSTLDGSGYMNADGTAQLFVDDVQVLDESGLYLALRDNWSDWRATGRLVTTNVWDGIYFSFGGYLDDVTVSTGAASAPTATRLMMALTGVG
jgi:hypothetical protein